MKHLAHWRSRTLQSRGTVRYFAVEIEAGGQISGDVQVTEEGLAGPAKTKPDMHSVVVETFEAAS
jgi:hypothetical protein